MQVAPTLSGTPPPLDSVLIWLSRTIEQDHEARGVFLWLREGAPFALRGAAALHVVSPPQASAIFHDANARYMTTRAGMCNAYRALIHAMMQAIEQGQARAAVAGDGIALYRKYAGRTCWVGTQEGLRRAGFAPAGLWPERSRWRAGTDKHGRRVHFYRHEPPWTDLFIVQVMQEAVPPPAPQRETDAVRRGIATARATTLSRLVSAPIVDLAAVRLLRAKYKGGNYA